MKKITAILLIVICTFTMLAGCSDSEIKQPEYTTNPLGYTTSPSGYITSPGKLCEITGALTYEVIEYDGEYVSVIDEAEELVRDWWNDDSTFTIPEIVWVDIIEGEFRGFQDKGYLFLDPDTTRQDLLATAVHEWIHNLVPFPTLIDIEREGWGRTVMEMVVEAITVDILGEENVEPTGNYLYFKECPELWENREALKKAYKEGKSYYAYEEILGTNYEEIIYMAEMRIL